MLSGEQAFEQAELREQLRAAGLPIKTDRGQDLAAAWVALEAEAELPLIVRANRERAALRRCRQASASPPQET